MAPTGSGAGTPEGLCERSPMQAKAFFGCVGSDRIDTVRKPGPPRAFAGVEHRFGSWPTRGAFHKSTNGLQK